MSAGRTASAGTTTTDCATLTAPAGFVIVSAYGQEGDEIDQVGWIYAQHAFIFILQFTVLLFVLCGVVCALCSCDSPAHVLQSMKSMVSLVSVSVHHAAGLANAAQRDGT
jgi:hypothetical protein